jgi:hypothetical protein
MRFVAEVIMRRILGAVLILFAVYAAGCSDSGGSYDETHVLASTDDIKIVSPVAIVPTQGYVERKNVYIKNALSSLGLDAQVVHVAQGEPVAEAPILAALAKADARKDCADFGLNAVIRMLCIDSKTNSLPAELREKMKATVLNFKYWYDEPGKSTTIFTTENHEILFHTAELLAGRLYPDEVFSNSGMTGSQHVEHAMHWANSWLGFRGRFGFNEFHSNIYYNETMPALVNLVDFSGDADISTKASILLDLMAFDFANNYFKGAYATAHGRTEDGKEVGYAADKLPSWESTNETAWLMLGLGQHLDPSHFTATFLATSDYVPPAILEEIANDATSSNEHRERMSPSLDEAEKYGIGFSTDEDITYWLTMSGLVAPHVVDGTLLLMKKYDMSGDVSPDVGVSDDIFAKFIKAAALAHFTNPTGYSEMLSDLTRGIMLESTSTYTYRTPDYQLSGAQDHQKGMSGMQELIWQASLDRYATVFTNSGPTLRGEDYVGGWKPRAMLYRNVGIIQYDRSAQMPLIEAMNLLLGPEFYTLAYFPKWAFDEVVTKGHWTFGRKGDGYVGLYSFKKPYWNANGIELHAPGKQNLYIVEMGSQSENGSFEAFMSGLAGAKVEAKYKLMGFDVAYASPSQGLVKVSWEGPMTVNGNVVDTGPYKRFDDRYCQQEFGDEKTIIDFAGKSLELDFANATREYYDMRMGPQ